MQQYPFPHSMNPHFYKYPDSCNYQTISVSYKMNTNFCYNIYSIIPLFSTNYLRTCTCIQNIILNKVEGQSLLINATKTIGYNLELLDLLKKRNSLIYLFIKKTKTLIISVLRI